MTTTSRSGRSSVRRLGGAVAGLGLAAAGVVAAQSPAAAANEVLTVTVFVAGDPNTAVAVSTGTLGQAPSERIRPYTANSFGFEFSPEVTPASGPGSTCTSDYVVVDSSPSDGVFVYKLTCDQPIDSYRVAISIGAGSCLHTQAGGLDAATYNVTTTQRDLTSGAGANGTFMPTGIGSWQWGSAIPAYVASTSGTVKDFPNPGTLTDEMGAYLPAVRACAPEPPGVNPTLSGGGLSVDPGGVGFSTNGGSAYFSGPVVGASGWRRFLALPRDLGNTGVSPWGGFRSTYGRCLVTDSSDPEQQCMLTQIPVTTNWQGGAGGFWALHNCLGQQVDVRNRLVTYMGLGLWSDATPVNLPGC